MTTKKAAKKITHRAVAKDALKHFVKINNPIKRLVKPREVDDFHAQHIAPKVADLALTQAVEAHAELVSRAEALAYDWEGGSFRNQRDCAKELLGMIHE